MAAALAAGKPALDTAQVCQPALEVPGLATATVDFSLFILDPYDLVLSKLSRNEERDRGDVKHLALTLHLDGDILRARYEAELKPHLIGPPERHNATLTFWLEAYFGKS